MPQTDNTNAALSSVDTIYAQALLDLAVEANEADAIDQQARDIVELLGQSEDLTRLFDSRVLSTEERERVIERVFKPQVHDLLHRFIQVVNQKDRLPQIAGILRAYSQLVEQRKGIVRVDAHVAMTLDDAGSQRLAEQIGEKLGKQVILTQHVEPHLIGGLKLRVGDRVIDGSVATQLKLMKQEMVARGREKARAEEAE